MSTELYPAGAVDEAITSLELSYSYLREEPVVGQQLRWSLYLLYRARELEQARHVTTEDAQATGRNGRLGS